MLLQRRRRLLGQAYGRLDSVGALVCPQIFATRSRVDFNQRFGLSVHRQSPATFNHHLAAVPRLMHEPAFPYPIADEFGFNFFQWLWKCCLQQLVADSAYGFLFTPAIESFGAAVPELDGSLHGAHDHAVMYEVKEQFYCCHGFTMSSHRDFCRVSISRQGFQQLVLKQRVCGAFYYLEAYGGLFRNVQKRVMAVG